MSNYIQKLSNEMLIHPPKWMATNIQYEVMTGSVAYGVSSDTSDVDLSGFCIPPKHMVFPHLAGDIEGFGRQKKRFEQFQVHHVSNRNNDKNYDITIYSIVKFFTLAMENNPNVLDLLYVPQNCVLFSTQVGNLVREKRNLFLSKACWPRFKGYAYSQLSSIRSGKIKDDNPVRQFEIENNIDVKTTLQDILDQLAALESNVIVRPENLSHLNWWQLNKYFQLYQSELSKSSRFEMIKVNSYDCKHAYHVYRLMDQCEQILILEDQDLQRAKEQMKSIRRGEWKEQDIYDYFTIKEKELEKAYADSKLPWGPREDEIKSLLLNCLEIHYGSLEGAIKVDVDVDKILCEIEDRVATIRRTL